MTVILPSLPSTGDTTATSTILINYKNSTTTLKDAIKARDLAKKNLWDVWDRIKKKNEAGREPSDSLIARETACETALATSKTAVTNAKDAHTLKKTAVTDRIEANTLLLESADDLVQDLESDIHDIHHDIELKNDDKRTKLEQIQTETDEGDSAAVSTLQTAVNEIDKSLNLLNTNKILKRGDIDIVKNFITTIKHEQTRLKELLHHVKDEEKHKCNAKVDSDEEVKCKRKSKDDSDDDEDSDEEVMCKRKTKVDVKCARKSKVESDDDEDSDEDSDDEVKCKRKSKESVKCKRKPKVESESESESDDSDDSDSDDDSDDESVSCAKPTDSNILDKVLGMMNINSSCAKSASSQMEMIPMLMLCMNGVYKNTSHIINSMPAGRPKDELKKFQKHIKQAMNMLSQHA